MHEGGESYTLSPADGSVNIQKKGGKGEKERHTIYIRLNEYTGSNQSVARGKL